MTRVFAPIAFISVPLTPSNETLFALVCATVAASQRRPDVLAKSQMPPAKIDKTMARSRTGNRQCLRIAAWGATKLCVDESVIIREPRRKKNPAVKHGYHAPRRGPVPVGRPECANELRCHTLLTCAERARHLLLHQHR